MQAFQAASLLSFIFHICSTQVIWGGNISGQKYSCITWNMDFNVQILCSLKWPEWCLNCIHWIGWWIRLNTQRVNKKLWILIAWNISWIPSSHSVKIDDTHSTPAGVGLCSLSYELVYNWFFSNLTRNLIGIFCIGLVTECKLQSVLICPSALFFLHENVISRKD